MENAPEVEKQMEQIQELLQNSLKAGDTWCLIDTKWFKHWKKYVNYDSWDKKKEAEVVSSPGKIDNSSLFADPATSELKEHLIDELDYVLLPENAWDLLATWYGVVDDHPAIKRKVVEFGMFVKQSKVEVYLMDFKLCENDDLEKTITKKYSRADTIETIENDMKELFGIPASKETRLWNRYTTNTYEQLSKRDASVQEVGLYQGQILVIEQQKDDGSWARVANVKAGLLNANSSNDGDKNQVNTNNSSNNFIDRTTRFGASSSYSNRYNSDNNSESSTVQRGLCGLSNLGNTCFMNSALQCLSNCPPLTRYFLEERHIQDLNVDNPLGMHGEIARTYGDLIKQMWSGKCSYAIPRQFKMQVGRFAPQFSGYQQQDSQELMAFLLDGLHEDLNRIKKKPYVEMKDAEGRSDDLVARESWEIYRQRNDSVIVDIFHGQLKSTLVCPECDKVSVTFDPFCYLTLPLPFKKERQLELFFVPADPSRRLIQCKVTVRKNGTIQDLKVAVGKLMDASPDKLLIADVYNYKFYKIFQSGDLVSVIADKDDIFAYEVLTDLDDPHTAIVPVHMREKRDSSDSNYASNAWHFFGTPFLISAPRKKCSANQLYQIVFNQILRYIELPDKTDIWWEESEGKATSNGELANGEGVTMENGSSGNHHGAWTAGTSSDDIDTTDSPPEDEQQRKTSRGTKKRQLFGMRFNSANGNNESGWLEDAQDIEFRKDLYLTIDWHPLAREKFFSSNKAEALDKHDSMDTKLQRKVIQLNECLELFTATERLSADDTWYCPQCKKHQQATKKFDLWQLPQVLVLSFKRFSYTRVWWDKIDTLVEFPINGLNMGKYIINSGHGPAVYDLLAVSNHYGGIGGGHYTAYAKNKEDVSWYCFDDSNVSPTTEDSVVSKAAYVLLYIRRDVADSIGLSSDFLPHYNNSVTRRHTGVASATVSSNPDGTDIDEEESMDTN